jgi:hypothetical protein
MYRPVSASVALQQAPTVNAQRRAQLSFRFSEAMGLMVNQETVRLPRRSGRVALSLSWRSGPGPVHARAGTFHAMEVDITFAFPLVDDQGQNREDEATCYFGARPASKITQDEKEKHCLEGCHYLK